jgi:hypothetical protein
VAARQVPIQSIRLSIAARSKRQTLRERSEAVTDKGLSLPGAQGKVRNIDSARMREDIEARIRFLMNDRGKQ